MEPTGRCTPLIHRCRAVEGGVTELQQQASSVTAQAKAELDGCEAELSRLAGVVAAFHSQIGQLLPPCGLDLAQSQAGVESAAAAFPPTTPN